MTLKQLHANRLNAKRCTGPRSDAGKERSRSNALKTGIYAQSQIVPGEDPAALEKLDSDPAEREVLDNIVHAARLNRRYRRIDAQLMKYEIDTTYKPNAASPRARISAPPAPGSSASRTASTPPTAPFTATWTSSASSKPSASSSDPSPSPHPIPKPGRPPTHRRPPIYPQSNPMKLQSKPGKWVRLAKSGSPAAAPPPAAELAPSPLAPWRAQPLTLAPFLTR